jgi:hypothetical protein
MPEVHFTRKLSCENCATTGEVVADTMGPFRVSDKFYLRAPPRLEGALQIICWKCGTQHKRPRADLGS